MKTRICAAALAVASALLPLPTQAQSSAIGFSGAELTLGHASGETGTLTTLDASADFAITAQHGLQLDLGIIDYGNIWFGTLAAHAYLQPTQAAKYGLFFAYSDADDREAATTEIGVEGIWSLGSSTTVEARAGMGRADPSEVDYLFASLGARHALTRQLALSGRLGIVDADEARAALTGTTLDLGLSYHLPDAPVALSLGASHTRISGTHTASETRVTIGLTAAIGGARTARATAAQRNFAPVRPLQPLLERGLVWDFVGSR